MTSYLSGRRPTSAEREFSQSARMERGHSTEPLITTADTPTFDAFRIAGYTTDHREFSFYIAKGKWKLYLAPYGCDYSEWVEHPFALGETDERVGVRGEYEKCLSFLLSLLPKFVDVEWIGPPGVEDDDYFTWDGHEDARARGMEAT